MALITDPDDLNQGTLTNVADLAFTASAGFTTTITGATTLPALADNEFFEIRSSAIPGNDGLYRVNDASPTTSSIDCDKITGPVPTNDTAESTDILGTTGTASEKSVMVDTTDRRIYLLEQGNLSVDGATEQAVYSFMKKRWKDDALLIQFDFPMVAITPEQFEFTENWNPEDNGTEVIQTRKLIRTGGWSEIDDGSNLIRQYSGIITLGNFEDDAADVAYYQLGSDPTDLTGAIDFDFAGPVNEAVLVFQELGNPATCTFATSSTITRASGSFITDGYKVGGRVTIRAATTGANDGTFVLTAVAATTLTVTGTPFTTEADPLAQLAADNRNILNVFIRIRDGDPNGKSYGKSTLTAIGVTTVDNKVFRYPLSSATDLNISETDANIDANSPYTQINLKYFDGVYSKDIDSATNRSFGGAVDVGTHTGIDGQTFSNTLLTTADGGIPGGGLYDGGVLTLYEGTDEGLTYTIANTTDNDIHTTTSLSATEGPGISYSIQRATPVVATLGEIYEKVQRELRKDLDINYLSGNTTVVVGRTADAMLEFVGSTLKTLQFTNPASGTSDGLAIEGFDTNDTNDLVQRDNTNTERSFPFVAAGTINFNNNLVSDTDPEFWMFFEYTIRTTVGDAALSSIVGANASLDSAGTNLPTTLAQFEYINIQGFAEANNNGIYEITDAAPTTAQADVRKYDGSTLVAAGATSVTLDENPIDSPSAVIVQDNSAADIVGAIASGSTTFDFDYDNNTQGGRTSATDAAIVLKAIGLETAQDAVTTGTITRATGLSFSLVSGLERNFTP